MIIDKYNFYIGSNNKTKKREIKKAINTLNKLNILGFNINKNLFGFWDNMQEKSFNIEILNTKEINFNDNKARDLKQLLENNLKQFLVLTTKQQIEIL